MQNASTLYKKLLALDKRRHKAFKTQHLIVIMRQVKDRNILDDFCVRFCTLLEKHCTYAVVSGFLAIASGRARGTEDIDIIVERLSPERFTQLHDDLVRRGFVCMQSDEPRVIYGYLMDKTSVRYTDKTIPLPEMEIKFARDVIDDYQLQHRVRLPMTQLQVWFASVESTIAFKEEYLKSDKDIEDAQHLRAVYAGEISEDEISHIKKLIRRHRA